VVLLLGIEPNLRWRTFSDLVVGLANDLGVELMITLGALLADVPHTRTAPVTGSASDEELVERLGLSASRYEGPTGIVGVLHDVCRQRGIPSASLWAAVPHYVSLTPRPRGALALGERLRPPPGGRVGGGWPLGRGAGRGWGCPRRGDGGLRLGAGAARRPARGGVGSAVGRR